MPRMQNLSLTLNDADFQRIEEKGTPKAQTIAKVGKLFLDFECTPQLLPFQKFMVDG